MQVESKWRTNLILNTTIYVATKIIVRLTQNYFSNLGRNDLAWLRDLKLKSFKNQSIIINETSFGQW